MALSLIIMSLIAISCFFNEALGHPKRQDFSVQTTFLYDDSCTPSNQDALKQAVTDALILANAALEDQDREIKTDSPADKVLNFETQAAIDFFGPSSKNKPYQAKIFDTFYRATQTYRGRGWSDWWNTRYVFMFCRDLHDNCKTTSAAYTINNKPMPNIVFCPPFFTNLTSHSVMVENIRQDTTGKMKLNLQNLRSQAATVLHEWLHINGTSSEVCKGGCSDVRQTMNGKLEKSYKTGAAKLLARRYLEAPSRNNDNYVYFALARFMEKEFKVYPPYPLKWDKNKSLEDNKKVDETQPGAPPRMSTFDFEYLDPIIGDGEESGSGPFSTEEINEDLLSASDYPDWYQPILDATEQSQFEGIVVPDWTPPAYMKPNINDVVCETTGGSPLIEDCVHAFGSINDPDFATVGARHKNKGETWWAGYVQSCALSIYYTEDWTEECKASILDVYGHVKSIFEGCSHGGLGRVGGHVPFGVAGCQGYAQIINTDHQAAP